ncbi:MAG TPA: UDP-N-acetylglucosamine 2-epimerase (hydrolyzing), partial [Clostridiales bacterium]|nr:UDP-N-acetylglucosamine 2-epimerase (hydrolyzing) [Clostridiales bacterium]
KNELEQSLKITLEKPYAVVTFHPVTLENESSAKQIEELLQAISMHNELNFIFTKSNSDTNSRIINQMIDNYVMEHTNCKAFTSLGATKYLSVVKYSSMVIGNSSSGIVEVPTLKIPTINIGDRQKGRIQTHSIINCEPNTDSIHNAMIKAKTPEFLEIIKTVNNPYEKENTSKMICDNIIYYIENGKINLKKKFYDLHYTE